MLPKINSRRAEFHPGRSIWHVQHKQNAHSKKSFSERYHLKDGENGIKQMTLWIKTFFKISTFKLMEAKLGNLCEMVLY